MRVYLISQLSLLLRVVLCFVGNEHLLHILVVDIDDASDDIAVALACQAVTDNGGEILVDVTAENAVPCRGGIVGTACRRIFAGEYKVCGTLGDADIMLPGVADIALQRLQGIVGIQRADGVDVIVGHCALINEGMVEPTVAAINVVDVAEVVHTFQTGGVAGTVTDADNLRLPAFRLFHHIAVLVRGELVEKNLREGHTEELCVEDHRQPCLRNVVAVKEFLYFRCRLFPTFQSGFQLFDERFILRNHVVIERRNLLLVWVIVKGCLRQVVNDILSVTIISGILVLLCTEDLTTDAVEVQQLTLSVENTATQPLTGILVTNILLCDSTADILRAVIHRLWT